MSALRWLLALVSPAFALALTFALAVLLTMLLERACPPERMVSGVCSARWYPHAELASFCVAAAMGGWSFVLLPSRVAPDHARHVAWLALGAGTAYAGLFLWHAGPDILGPAIGAFAGGLLAVHRVHRVGSSPA